MNHRIPRKRKKRIVKELKKFLPIVMPEIIRHATVMATVVMEASQRTTNAVKGEPVAVLRNPFNTEEK